MKYFIQSVRIPQKKRQFPQNDHKMYPSVNLSVCSKKMHLYSQLHQLFLYFELKNRNLNSSGSKQKY